MASVFNLQVFQFCKKLRPTTGYCLLLVVKFECTISQNVYFNCVLCCYKVKNLCLRKFSIYDEFLMIYLTMLQSVLAPWPSTVL